MIAACGIKPAANGSTNGGSSGSATGSSNGTNDDGYQSPASGTLKTSDSAATVNASLTKAEAYFLRESEGGKTASAFQIVSAFDPNDSSSNTLAVSAPAGTSTAVFLSSIVITSTTGAELTTGTYTSSDPSTASTIICGGIDFTLATSSTEISFSADSANACDSGTANDTPVGTWTLHISSVAPCSANGCTNVGLVSAGFYQVHGTLEATLVNATDADQTAPSSPTLAVNLTF